jgi:hypothetical protein
MVFQAVSIYYSYKSDITDILGLVARLNQSMRSEKSITNILGYFFPKTLTYPFTIK